MMSWQRLNPGKELSVNVIGANYKEFGLRVGEVVSVYLGDDNRVNYDVLVEDRYLLTRLIAERFESVVPRRGTVLQAKAVVGSAPLDDEAELASVGAAFVVAYAKAVMVEQIIDVVCLPNQSHNVAMYLREKRWLLVPQQA